MEKQESIKCNTVIELRRNVNNTRRVLRRLCGTLRAEPEGWMVRVSDDGLRALCSEANLPKGSESGALVVFDAVPAFDRTHGCETSRATNVRLLEPAESV